MGRIVRTKRSDRDLFEISTYIAKDNPRAADALIDSIGQKLRLLSELPSMGHERPEFGKDLRSFREGNYLIFYRPLTDGIILLRVLHGARNLRKIFKRR